MIVLSSCSVKKNIQTTTTTDIQTNPYSATLLINDSALNTAHIGIALYNVDNNNYLYQYQSNKYFIPASNTKIMTCYAAMKYLGDSLPGIKYRIVNDNNIYVQPIGDPTFLHPLFPYQPVAELLSQYKYVWMNVVPYTLPSLYGNGWSWNDYNDDYMAAKTIFPIYGGLAHISLNTNGSWIHVFPPELNKIIQGNDLNNGMKVSRSLEANTFTVTPGKKTNVVIPFYPSQKDIDAMLEDSLKVKIKHTDQGENIDKVIYTQPTDSVLKLMMFESDNFIAEQCLTMIGVYVLKTKEDQQTIDTVLKNNLSGLAQHPRWVDGCGLSRYNLFTPEDIVYVLGKVRNEFKQNRIKAILPAGNQGTLKGYYTNYSDNIHAKTGSMSGVFCISGYLTTKQNKHITFSVMVNNHQAKGESLRRKIEAYLSNIIERN